MEEYGPLSSAELRELGIAQEARRAWKATRMANVALIALWNRGRISVAYRKNFRRYFDLTERVIPASLLGSPTPTLEEFWKWLLY